MVETENLLSDFTFICSDVLKLNIENNLHTYKGDDSLSRNFAIDYDVEEISKIDNNLYGSVILHLNLYMHYKQNTYLKISTDIKGVFRSSDDTGIASFKNMLELNGVTALYGISRGILASISSVAFPKEVIRLPLLNINRLIQQKHSN